MASLTKKQKDNDSKIETGVRYSVTDALNLVKDCATAKFDESIDVSINLGIDSKKSDQKVRGAVVLPNGTGKVVRVAVFTQGDNVQKANDAGADVVGMNCLRGPNIMLPYLKKIREKIYKILTNIIPFGVGAASVKEIEEKNISVENATYLQNINNLEENKQHHQNDSAMPNFEVESIELATPQLFSDEAQIKEQEEEEVI